MMYPNQEIPAELVTGYWVSMIVGVALGVLSLVSLWKVFKKAGEPGWAAIVPLYNVYTMFKITWGSGWKCLLMLIPFANIAIAILSMIKLAKVFGKSTGFAVGLVFLSFIFLPILAFGDAAYQGVPQQDKSQAQG